MRMDTATLVRSISEAIGSGAMAPNEGRKRLSLPPVAGGDTPYLQQQNYSLAALDERDKASPLVVRDVTPANDDDEEDDAVEEAVERAMRPYLEAVRKSDSTALAARFEVLLNA
jgi:phage portal protein BeeE